MYNNKKSYERKREFNKLFNCEINRSSLANIHERFNPTIHYLYMYILTVLPNSCFSYASFTIHILRYSQLLFKFSAYLSTGIIYRTIIATMMMMTCEGIEFA